VLKVGRKRKVFELDEGICKKLEKYSADSTLDQYKIVELALEEYLKGKVKEV